MAKQKEGLTFEIMESFLKREQEEKQRMTELFNISDQENVNATEKSSAEKSEKESKQKVVRQENTIHIIKNLDTDKLRKNLNNRIFGQEEAVESLISGIEQIQLFGAETGKPISVMLFDGPTGVGKTEFAKAVAEEIFGGDLIHVPLGSYNGSQLKNSLSGSAYGYIGSDEKVNFVEEIKNKPNAVLLLDEIEKPLSDDGGKAAQGIFLDMFDEARFTTQKGETLDLSGQIIIATTNAQATKDEVFTPEFKARFKSKIDFKPISLETAKKIALKTINKKVKAFEKQQQINGYKNTLDINENFAEYVASQSDYKNEGARVIITKVGEILSSLLANKLREEMPTNKEIRIEMKNKNPIVKIISIKDNSMVPEL